jgi:hypothetical protein
MKLRKKKSIKKQCETEQILIKRIKTKFNIKTS